MGRASNKVGFAAAVLLLSLTHVCFARPLSRSATDGELGVSGMSGFGPLLVMQRMRSAAATAAQCRVVHNAQLVSLAHTLILSCVDIESAINLACRFVFSLTWNFQGRSLSSSADFGQ